MADAVVLVVHSDYCSEFLDFKSHGKKVCFEGFDAFVLECAGIAIVIMADVMIGREKWSWINHGAPPASILAVVQEYSPRDLFVTAHAGGLRETADPRQFRRCPDHEQGLRKTLRESHSLELDNIDVRSLHAGEGCPVDIAIRNLYRSIEGLDDGDDDAIVEDVAAMCEVFAQQHTPSKADLEAHGIKNDLNAISNDVQSYETKELASRAHPEAWSEIVRRLEDLKTHGREVVQARLAYIVNDGRGYDVRQIQDCLKRLENAFAQLELGEAPVLESGSLRKDASPRFKPQKDLVSQAFIELAGLIPNDVWENVGHG